MDITELCGLIGLQEEVEEKVRQIDKTYQHDEISFMWEKLYNRDSWDEGIKELQQHFGEDGDGMKILTCILHCALHTHELYVRKGIDETIFADTVKFLPRFLEEHKKTHGFYRFTWAWWFPRQLALQEFRIGALEYELAGKDGVPQIYIHIPSDADLRRESLQGSYSGLRKFLEQFYPGYSGAELFCESWMMVPVLQDLLKEDSNILYFQSSFEIVSVDEESMAFMDWIYPQRDMAIDKLPECTSLQKEVKKHLSNGGKVGWALGKFKGFA